MSLLLQSAGAGARRRRAADRRCGSTCWRRAARLGVLQLHLSGGEPTVRRDLEEIVAAGGQGRALLQPHHRRRAADARAAGGAGDARPRPRADLVPGRRSRERRAHRPLSPARTLRSSTSPLGARARVAAHRSMPPIHRAEHRQRPAPSSSWRSASARSGSKSRTCNITAGRSQPRGADADARAGARSAELVERARERLKGVLVIDYRGARLLRQPSQALHGRLGPRHHQHHARRQGAALPRRRDHPGPRLRQRAGAAAARHLAQSEAFQRFRGTDVDARALPLLRADARSTGAAAAARPWPSPATPHAPIRPAASPRCTDAFAIVRDRKSALPALDSCTAIPGWTHNCDVGRAHAFRVSCRLAPYSDPRPPRKTKEISGRRPSCRDQRISDSQARGLDRPGRAHGGLGRRRAASAAGAGAAAAARLEAGSAGGHQRNPSWRPSPRRRCRPPADKLPLDKLKVQSRLQDRGLCGRRSQRAHAAARRQGNRIRQQPRAGQGTCHRREERQARGEGHRLRPAPAERHRPAQGHALHRRAVPDLQDREDRGQSRQPAQADGHPGPICRRTSRTAGNISPSAPTRSSTSRSAPPATSACPRSGTPRSSASVSIGKGLEVYATGSARSSAWTGIRP